MIPNKLRVPTNKELAKGTLISAGLGGALGGGIAALHPDVEGTKENLLESGALGAGALGASTLGAGLLVKKNPELLKRLVLQGQNKVAHLTTREKIAQYVDGSTR